MSSWTENVLEKIRSSDDLHISPLRDDGVTYGTPTWIWSVVVDDDLYVRAYNGKDSSWFKAAISQKKGRIHAAGMILDVEFEPVEDDSINERIDSAYQAKYKGSPYLPPMISSRAKSATVRVVSQTGLDRAGEGSRD